MKMKTDWLATFWLKIILVNWFTTNLHSDSDNDDKVANKLNYDQTFGVGAHAYGGAFNNQVPDRVGSAPATDINLVKLLKLLILLEIWSIFKWITSTS